MTDDLTPEHVLDALDLFGNEVLDWHRRNFIDHPRASWMHAASTILGITKVAEEAGELVGAVTRIVEGRTDLTPEDAIEKAYDELGDVVIAAVGALRRLNDLVDGEVRTFSDVVLTRWAEVSTRTYRQDPTA